MDGSLCGAGLPVPWPGAGVVAPRLACSRSALVAIGDPRIATPPMDGLRPLAPYAGGVDLLPCSSKNGVW